MTESWATEVRAFPWPHCDSVSGQLRAKHACMYILIELARHARMCKNLSMHDTLSDTGRCIITFTFTVLIQLEKC